MKRVTGVLALAALALAGVFAGVFLPAGGAAPKAAAAVDANVTKVTVKASEFKYAFSRKSAPTGTVLFTVVNNGKISHDFKIAGKKTKVLAPGKSQVLKVVIGKKGQYAFLCTLAGHASAGMKGKYAVGTAPLRTTSVATKAAGTTKVTVKASEFKYAFSKKSAPTGTVVFTVINTGKISHDFKIGGKKTPVLSPGKRATLRVVLKKKGQYAFICTLTGHAGAGMKGKYAIGTAPVKTTTPTPTTPTPTTPVPTTPPPTGTLGSANSTVQVGMFEYGYNLSSQSLPSGQVTFVIKNNGSEVHNFSIQGVKTGKILDPGQTETWTVALPPTRYSYVCDVPFHIDRGMIGSLNVSQ